MAMRKRNGFHVGTSDLRIARQPLTPFHARMRAGIKQEGVLAGFNKPRAGADGVDWIKIGHTHAAD